jgi:hypothetical protein
MSLHQKPRPSGRCNSQKIALRKLNEKLGNTLPENKEKDEHSGTHMKKLKI